MDSAKKAVKSFLHRNGKHETDVHETVAPAVTHENVERRQHEEVTTAVDREIHQDHYHTTVQPITTTEVLPEQHHHLVAPVEHREFDHGDVSDSQRRLHAEASRHRNETTHSEAAPTVTQNPTATGTTHVHHHIHETIQPVLEKKVIERHVVHTTVPIHETHHNPAEHHATSTLPTVSMDEFQRGGGAVSGHPQGVSRAAGGPSTGGEAAQGTRFGLDGAGASPTRNVGTGVAGNAAVSAARAAAMGQRPS